MTNPCLRPASISDLEPENNDFCWFDLVDPFETGDGILPDALYELYDAEWKLRGFQRSP